MTIDEKLAVMAAAILDIAKRAASVWDFDGEQMTGAGVALTAQQELEDIARGVAAPGYICINDARGNTFVENVIRRPVAWLVNTKVSGQPEYRVSEPGAPGAFPVYTDVQAAISLAAEAEPVAWRWRSPKYRVLSRRSIANTAGEAVSVKPLEWRKSNVADRWVATHPWGELEIIHDARTHDYGWFVGGVWFWCKTLAEAQANAQANFDQAIQSCLTSPAAEPAEGNQPEAWLLHRVVDGELTDIKVSLFAISDGDRSLGWTDKPLYTHPSSPVSAEVTDTPELRGLIAEAEMQCAHPNVHFHYTDGARVMAALAAALKSALNGGRENG